MLGSLILEVMVHIAFGVLTVSDGGDDPAKWIDDVPPILSHGPVHGFLPPRQHEILVLDTLNVLSAHGTTPRTSTASILPYPLHRCDQSIERDVCNGFRNCFVDDQYDFLIVSKR